MKKNLICYFSCSGVTKGVSEKLASFIDADLFEIVPVKAYTDEDLDWTNKSSRSTIEMNDESFRPKIKNKLDNIDNYEKIIIGFPVWWYREPSIIDTFIEEKNLTGKEIYIFVTSGSSSSESSFDSLKNKYIELNLKGHIRLNNNFTKEEINYWLM